MQRIMMILVMLVTLVACTNAQSNEMDITKEQKDLHDIWVLVSLGNEAANELNYPKELPSMEINVEKSIIGGFTGCNRFFGAALIDNSQLSFEDIGATKMYCMGVPEKQFLRMLGEVHSYERDGLSLVFKDVDGEAISVWKKVD